MKRKITAGSTSVQLAVFVQSTASTTGAGLSSLAHNTAGLVAEYRRAGQSSWTAITLIAGTLGTYASGGFVADGALDGAYEFDPPDAAFASGASFVLLRLRGAANMLPVLIEVELDVVNYQTARFGAAAAGDAMTLTSGANDAIWAVSSRTLTSFGTLVSDIATAVWAAGTRSLTTFGTLVSDVWSNGTRTLTAISDSAGITTLLSRIVGTLASGTHNPQSGDSFARLGAPTGASISADIQTRAAPGAAMALTSGERNTLTSQIEAEILNDATGGAAVATIATAVAAYFDSATLDLPPQIIAAAVRNNLATELGRLDVAISTRPSAAAIATEVRTELTTELARIDVANSTRLAAASYSAPPSASAISTQVNTDLTAAHGAGTWTTATGFATEAQATAINDLLDPEIAQMKVILDQLATMLQGTGPYKFTSDALSLAPAGGGGGGGGDWNVDEKSTIKAVLGIPNTGTTPVTPTTGILATLHTLVKLATAGAVGTVQISGAGDVKTLAFKDTDGTTTIATVQWNTATGARTRL